MQGVRLNHAMAEPSAYPFQYQLLLEPVTDNPSCQCRQGDTAAAAVVTNRRQGEGLLLGRQEEGCRQRQDEHPAGEHVCTFW